jgi:hypothetical protein
MQGISLLTRRRRQQHGTSLKVRRRVLNYDRTAATAARVAR